MEGRQVTSGSGTVLAGPLARTLARRVTRLGSLYRCVMRSSYWTIYEWKGMTM